MAEPLDLDEVAVRVLDRMPVDTLDAWESLGGLQGLQAARKLGPAAVVEEVAASGLRGRGGAGFPTGTKWQSVIANRSDEVPTTVVVNGAEGEPGSFKDRALLRRNPYRVLEGALIAAFAVGADRIVFALKQSFGEETTRLQQAIAQLTGGGWVEGTSIEVFGGPAEYLYGEETALLEVLDGRPPFPRVAPPYRHGVDEMGEGGVSAADVSMAAPGSPTGAPPTLANNVETIANLPGILSEGPDWFRSLGTAESPGTIVCTVTGRTRRHAVGEVALGTPVREIVEVIGGGPVDDRRVVAVMSGVAHPLLPESLLHTPATYEDLEAAGSGLGAASFIVFDDATDLAAVAAGVARFLAVESCGQCTPCKQDGLAIAGALQRLCRGEAAELDVVEVADRVRTVADEARCFLAHQHQRVVGSILEQFPDALRAHVDGRVEPVEPEPIVAIADLTTKRAVLDEGQLAKQPDWTFDAEDSGKSPADRLDRDTGTEPGR